MLTVELFFALLLVCSNLCFLDVHWSWSLPFNPTFCLCIPLGYKLLFNKGKAVNYKTAIRMQWLSAQATIHNAGGV
jgi:hypothetical protein